MNEYIEIINENLHVLHEKVTSVCGRVWQSSLVQIRQKEEKGTHFYQELN